MGKCGIAKILFYAYSLILLVGYALFAVVNYYPPAQSIVLKEGARVKLSYVALQNSQPPLITIERESGQAKLHAASVESSPDDIIYQVYTLQNTSKRTAHARRRIDIRCLDCADTPIGLNHIEVEILSLRPEIRGEIARVYLASRTGLDSAFRTPLNRGLDRQYLWLAQSVSTLPRLAGCLADLGCVAVSSAAPQVAKKLTQVSDDLKTSIFNLYKKDKYFDYHHRKRSQIHQQLPDQARQRLGRALGCENQRLLGHGIQP